MSYHSTAKKPIIIAAGTWSTNIGNAFFQLGAQFLMSQVAGERSVQMLTDQPGYWKYGKKKNFRNSLRLLDYVDADYVVLAGSLLTYNFPELWVQTFQYYKERNMRIILLGVGQFDYSKQETSLCRELLRKYPPYIFVARDSTTYENFKDICPNSYNGIDNAYFLPRAFPKIELNSPPYIMLNFDKGPEPMLQLENDNFDYIWGKSDYSDCRVPFGSKTLDIRFPKIKKMLADKSGKYYGYIATLLGLKRNSKNNMSDYLIFRADHQTNPLYHRKLYYGPNSFAADIPYGYLSLYANASITLSDRIHACIIAMAYGATAMLFSKSPRMYIIEQVGATSINQKPTSLDLQKLRKLQDEELDFLRSVIL